MEPDIREIIEDIFIDKELMTQALTRKDWVEQIGSKKTPLELQHQDGLDTIGDVVLDFCILRFFYDDKILPPADFDEKRQFYGANLNLKKLSFECLHLENAVIWSPNEHYQKAWEKEEDKIPLAKCFEALIGGLYLDGGIPSVENFLKQIKFHQTIDEIHRK